MGCFRLVAISFWILLLVPMCMMSNIHKGSNGSSSKYAQNENVEWLFFLGFSAFMFLLAFGPGVFMEWWNNRKLRKARLANEERSLLQIEAAKKAETDRIATETIDLSDSKAVTSLAKRLKATELQLRIAIRDAGPLVQDVKRALQK